jgi:hypothetical protein
MKQKFLSNKAKLNNEKVEEYARLAIQLDSEDWFCLRTPYWWSLTNEHIDEKIILISHYINKGTPLK